MAERTDLTREIGEGTDRSTEAVRRDIAARRDTISDTDRSTEAIRRDIAARRDSISDTVDQLSDRVQAALDWRTYIAEHPFAAIGVTAGLAFAASALVRRRRAPQDRIMDALAESVEDLAGRFREGLDTLPLIRRARIGRLVWSFASTAAAAAISRTIKKKRESRIEKGAEGRPEPEPRMAAAHASSRSEFD